MNEEVFMKLDDKTTIPLFAYIASIPFLVGGILWLATIHAKANNAEMKLNTLEQAIVDIAVIKTDIKYIKANLDTKKEK